MTIGCGSADFRYCPGLCGLSVGTKENRDCRWNSLWFSATLPESLSRELAQGLPTVVFKTIVIVDLFSRYKKLFLLKSGEKTPHV